MNDEIKGDWNFMVWVMLACFLSGAIACLIVIGEVDKITSLERDNYELIANLLIANENPQCNKVFHLIPYNEYMITEQNIKLKEQIDLYNTCVSLQKFCYEE